MESRTYKKHIQQKNEKRKKNNAKQRKTKQNQKAGENMRAWVLVYVKTYKTRTPARWIVWIAAVISSSFDRGRGDAFTICISEWIDTVVGTEGEAPARNVRNSQY